MCACTDVRSERTYNPWIGLTLALLSAVLIGSSVILKKKALLRLLKKGSTRDWLWWSGLLTMGSGEVCNFVAYMFAPATLVTPLGALSVLISAVLSSYLLGELLNVVGKLGCLICILGSILLVIHAPQEQEVTSLEEMTKMLLQPGFLTFVALVLAACAVLVIFVCPRFGRTNVLAYVSVCSLLGAFSVSSVKGLAIVLHKGETNSGGPLTWILLLTLIVSIATQVNYLNKSLDSFSTLLVYPIYYVFFTSVVLLTSIILFQEWYSMAAVDVATTLCAFLVIVVGVAMLHLFRELQVSVCDAQVQNVLQ
uniref:Magnesium transporter NIPA3-like n=1 Tax=Gouania willdenowi TaxID=441366 RepID=A0A8C5E3F3_GOUWI